MTPNVEQADGKADSAPVVDVDAPAAQSTTPAEETQPKETTTLTANEEAPEPPKKSIWQRIVDFYFGNEFLLLVIAAILLARAYPPLGAEYLVPEITATWIAVCIIFIMAGLGLKTEEFSKAFQQVWFNLFVQCFNFGFVSAIIYVVSLGLKEWNILTEDLADGLVVAGSLPMTINMVLVLTKAGGGDESLAIINAASGNLVGVFLSPLLILGYLGVTGDVDLFEVFYKLALRVVLPVGIGQIIQKCMPKVVAFYKTHKKKFKKLQEYCLVFIVYTVFCRTFEDESESSIADIFISIGFVFIFLIGFMFVAWYALKILFRDHPEMRVMGLFGCTHKTVAMGVPLINAIYENNSAVGLYTLPLLIWHPMQLVIGTFLAPRLTAFVERERLRLDGPPKEEQPDPDSPDEEVGKDEPSLFAKAEEPSSNIDMTRSVY